MAFVQTDFPTNQWPNLWERVYEGRFLICADGDTDCVPFTVYQVEEGYGWNGEGPSPEWVGGFGTLQEAEGVVDQLLKS